MHARFHLEQIRTGVCVLCAIDQIMRVGSDGGDGGDRGGSGGNGGVNKKGLQTYFRCVYVNAPFDVMMTL